MRYFGHVFATKTLVENRLPVAFMYRETPDGKTDSGWRFFSGVEDQAYVDDPNNIGIYSVDTVLKIDPAIAPYLLSEPRKAYERISGSNEFREVPDFRFEAENER